jgi:hypothetical protein
VEIAQAEAAAGSHRFCIQVLTSCFVLLEHFVERVVDFEARRGGTGRLRNERVAMVSWWLTRQNLPLASVPMPTCFFGLCS